MALQENPASDAPARRYRRSTFRTLAAWLVTTALVGYVASVLASEWETLSARFSGTVRHGVLLGLGILGSWAVTSLQTLLPLRELGFRISFFENFVLTVATIFVNYLPMRAGSLMRFEYLRSVHGVGYLRFGGLLAARSLILLWVAAAVGLIGAVAMRTLGHETRIGAFVIFGAVAVLAPLLLLAPERLLPRRLRSIRVAADFIDGVTLVRRNGRLLLLYATMVLLQLGFLTARLAVAFDAIGHHPPLWAYCFLSPIATILSFVNITPGNLGLRESLVGVLSAAVGLDYADGIFAASIDRGVLILMTLLAGAPASAFLAWRMTRRRADEPSEPGSLAPGRR